MSDWELGQQSCEDEDSFSHSLQFEDVGTSQFGCRRGFVGSTHGSLTETMEQTGRTVSESSDDTEIDECDFHSIPEGGRNKVNHHDFWTDSFSDGEEAASHVTKARVFDSPRMRDWDGRDEFKFLENLESDKSMDCLNVMQCDGDASNADISRESLHHISSGVEPGGCDEWENETVIGDDDDNFTSIEGNRCSTVSFNTWEESRLGLKPEVSTKTTENANGNGNEGLELTCVQLRRSPTGWTVRYNNMATGVAAENLIISCSPNYETGLGELDDDDWDASPASVATGAASAHESQWNQMAGVSSRREFPFDRYNSACGPSKSQNGFPGRQRSNFTRNDGYRGSKTRREITKKASCDDWEVGDQGGAGQSGSEGGLNSVRKSRENGNWGNQRDGQKRGAGRGSQNGGGNYRGNGNRYYQGGRSSSRTSFRGTGRRCDVPNPFRHVPDALPAGDELFVVREALYDGVGSRFAELEAVENKPSQNFIDLKLEPMNTFEEMNLDLIFLANITRLDYPQPTPIQKYTVPVIQAKLDVMARAQNGTGKTAAFLLPILNGIYSDAELLRGGSLQTPKPVCLILSPTRELAVQIAKESHMYAHGTGIVTAKVYGGTCEINMKAILELGCHVVVATPGRLIQVLEDEILNLENVKYFILDEADRMLDRGFFDAIHKIISFLPPKENRISGLFSATFPDEVIELAKVILRDYVSISSGLLNAVTQEFIEVTQENKVATVIQVLKGMEQDEKIIVFCGTRLATDFVAVRLSEAGISSTSIHGGRLQCQRELAIKKFADGSHRVLVATAVAARGLDIPKVTVVMNFDLPEDIDEYLHRIGRTGRIGHVGRSISFYDHNFDSHLANDLVTVLRNAQEEVPAFLTRTSMSMGTGEGQGGESGDVHNNHHNFQQNVTVTKNINLDEDNWG